MAHNALIFYAYLSLKQHNVHEQALLCHPWMSTSPLSHQFLLPETLNHQTPVLLCELAFYSRVSQTCSGASPLALTQPSHLVSHSLFLSPSFPFTCRRPFSPSLFLTLTVPLYSLLLYLALPFFLSSSLYHICPSVSLLLSFSTLHSLSLPVSLCCHFLYAFI